MTNLGPKLNSLYDERSWGNDAYGFSNSIFKVQPDYISYGTLSNSLDKDYFQLNVQSGYKYEVYLTSDWLNHGWNSYNNGSFIEFDIVNSYGSIEISSTPLLIYDDKVEFTAS